MRRADTNYRVVGRPLLAGGAKGEKRFKTKVKGSLIFVFAFSEIKMKQKCFCFFNVLFFFFWLPSVFDRSVSAFDDLFQNSKRQKKRNGCIHPRCGSRAMPAAALEPRQLHVQQTMKLTSKSRGGDACLFGTLSPNPANTSAQEKNFEHNSNTAKTWADTNTRHQFSDTVPRFGLKSPLLTLASNS